MDKGIVIFAHNSRSLDYSKLALVAGGLAKKHLGYPVSLITDKSTVDYMEEIGTADKAKEIIDSSGLNVLSATAFDEAANKVQSAIN